MKQKKIIYMIFSNIKPLLLSSFGESIYTHKANIVEAEEDQSNLLKIWSNIMINLDQDQKKARIKEGILKVHMFFVRVEN